ncbi:hypothetical protein JM658_16335 [Joostella atrarenae]|uniref:Uncharacterized protein n=1 Tax=Joostella atrarenae TaxID=679257 RepID=A0ABS9J7L7_9FLAO|nr:hypothetical protein [Joostella atrarenae]MCF8716400.1 hypothetical protein [Joostella atrarenae]
MNKLENRRDSVDEFYVNVSSSVGMQLNNITYDKFIELIVKSLELRPKVRVLDLYFGINPLTSFILEDASVSYFALDSSINFVNKAAVVYKEYISKRKAIFSCFENNDIPYVNQFFHRILSINPRIDRSQLTDYINEVFYKVCNGGRMILVFSIQSYEDVLSLLDAINLSLFKVEDFMVFELSMCYQSELEKDKSVLFKLNKLQ